MSQRNKTKTKVCGDNKMECGFGNSLCPFKEVGMAGYMKAFSSQRTFLRVLTPCVSIKITEINNCNRSI